jgi:hypothetical protein
MRAACLAIAVALCACSTVEVNSDWDPSAKFSGLRTWTWQRGTPEATGNPRLDDPLVHKRIQTAIVLGLQKKGYRLVSPPEKPDFEVSYNVAINQKLDARTIYTGYGPYRGWVGGSQTIVDTYDVGTLILDFVDPATNSVIWRGTAQTRLQELKTPEERERRVQEVVDDVLERFPPDE